MVPERQRIEPATRADLEAVTDCWVALAHEQRAHGSRLLPEANRASILEVLSAHQFDGGLLVARVADDVVGFATVSVERGTFELDATRGVLSNLYVKPPFRDRGIGAALLEAAEERLAARGVEVVTLEAMATNEAARRFYRRHGYETYRVAMERSLADENDTHSKEDG